MEFSEKDEIFLLAKVHLAEALVTNFIAVLAVLYGGATKNPPSELIDTLEHNMKERIRLRARVQEGDTTRIDPLALQAEMLRQLGPAVQAMREALERYLGKRAR